MVIMDTLKSSKRELFDCWRGNLGVGPSKDEKLCTEKAVEWKRNHAQYKET